MRETLIWTFCFLGITMVELMLVYIFLSPDTLSDSAVVLALIGGAVGAWKLLVPKND